MTDILPPSRFSIEYAVKAAQNSPCRKSRRGVVFWRNLSRYSAGGPAAMGWNHPPLIESCTDECLASKLCANKAIHAEMACIKNFFDKRHTQRPLPSEDDTMNIYEGLHVKVDQDGNLVTSGGPSCVECSKHLFDFGLRAFWLFHDKGFRIEGDEGVSQFWMDGYDGTFTRYPIDLFHELSLKANGLPVYR